MSVELTLLFIVTELNISEFLFLAEDKGGFNEGARYN